MIIDFILRRRPQSVTSLLISSVQQIVANGVLENTWIPVVHNIGVQNGDRENQMGVLYLTKSNGVILLYPTSPIEYFFGFARNRIQKKCYCNLSGAVCHPDEFEECKRYSNDFNKIREVFTDVLSKKGFQFELKDTR